MQRAAQDADARGVLVPLRRGQGLDGFRRGVRALVVAQDHRCRGDAELALLREPDGPGQAQDTVGVVDGVQRVAQRGLGPQAQALVHGLAQVLVHRAGAPVEMDATGAGLDHHRGREHRVQGTGVSHRVGAVLGVQVQPDAERVVDVGLRPALAMRGNF